MKPGRSFADSRGLVARGLLVSIALASVSVEARIPEYQIVRIIAYQTNCKLLELTSRDNGDEGVEFHGTCENVASYPDGVSLQCPDREDAYQCAILTEERQFKFLNSLREPADSGV